jgi:predicted DNA-binding transcriptional regulator AlpA
MTILTTIEAANRCGVSASFLHKSRIRGDGPPFLKIGRRTVRYDVAKLDAWLAAHERRSTSEPARHAEAEPATRHALPRRQKVALRSQRGATEARDRP